MERKESSSEEKKRDLRLEVAAVADRLDRAADAKAAALVTGGGWSGASVVYELRAVARELRELVQAATEEADR